MTTIIIQKTDARYFDRLRNKLADEAKERVAEIEQSANTKKAQLYLELLDKGLDKPLDTTQINRLRVTLKRATK